MFLILGCSSLETTRVDLMDSKEVEFVDDVDYVIANPETLDGKVVEVRGFLTMNFEGNTICHNADYLFDRCLRVVFSRLDQNSKALPPDKLIGPISVRGVFKKEDLDFEPVTYTNPGVFVQFGPLWHSLSNAFLVNVSSGG